MIADEIQENIHLDYKRSEAIQNNKRDEIAKDVSAFANSDGGVLVYGVEEKDHLPIKIDDGVDDSKFSREWIESAILTRITPKVPDSRIVPVTLSPGRSMYIIIVAKSYQGPHQAGDKKYYKRFNFSSEPMEHYEVSDVRNRRLHRSPFDEHVQADIRETLLILQPKEKDFLVWLLKVGRVYGPQIVHDGFESESISVTQKTGALLVGFEAIKPGNGLMEMGRVYFINPSLKDPLKEALFPGSE